MPCPYRPLPPLPPLREQVRPRPARPPWPPACLPVARPFLPRAGGRVAELLRARAPFPGAENLEHQLTRRDHGGGVLLRRESDLFHQIEHTGHDAEAFEARLRALVRRDLER